MTIIYNNDTTSYDTVIVTLIAATHCSAEEAEIEVWEAHHYGKAPVHFSSKDECEQVAKVMQAVGVSASVEPEWQE